jgi:flavin reductase (DIM6/NTAB) family NADH-FMN oxidoreductase RutF
MSRFATGVTVVTYLGEEGPRGATMNSFTSVSADPPLILVSVARRARCHDRLISGPFCVNVLSADQEPLARLFAGAPAQVEPAWAQGAAAPRLAHPLAWVECEPWQVYDGGDHSLVLGKVTGTGYREGDALLYAWSRFSMVAESALGIEYLF